MELRKYAKMLNTEPNRFKEIINKSIETISIIRQNRSIPFQMIAKKICEHYKYSLLVKAELDEETPGMAIKNNDGSISIVLGALTNALKDRVVFYHELAHSILHMQLLQTGTIKDHSEELIEAEAWLFSINCAVHDNLSTIDDISKLIIDFSFRLPAKYAQAFYVVSQYFSDNWVNVSEEKTVQAYAEPLIITVNNIIIEKIAINPRLIYDFDGYGFEKFMAELFDGLGYLVEQTTKTRDGGVDILAVKNIDNVSLRFLIECKKYSERKKVGVSLVRSLFGVKHHIGASKAIIATTSRFTKPAVDFAEAHKWDLELKDFDGIMHWINLYLKKNKA